MLNYTETKLGMNETFKATILDAQRKPAKCAISLSAI
jgi:hypothetical protein